MSRQVLNFLLKSLFGVVYVHWGLNFSYEYNGGFPHREQYKNVQWRYVAASGYLYFSASGYIYFSSSLSAAGVARV